MPEFVGLLARLADAGVDFVLVGGLAAAVQGSSHVTQDVDVCVKLGAANLRRLSLALEDLHPRHRMGPREITFQHEDDILETFKNVYLQTDWGQLDCLGNVLGVGGFDEVKKQSEILRLEGRDIRVLTLEALLTAKRQLHRAKDLAVVEELKALLKLRDESAPG